MIFHITPRTAWDEAQQRGNYRAESLATEGFIHCSTISQVLPVAENFYTTTDTKFARDFLNLYDVRYIIVGQLERAEYRSENVPSGLSKFEEFDGVYWRSVFEDGKTVIYEVIE